MSKSKSKADEAEAAGTMSKAEEVIKKETGADLLRDATGDTVENREDKVYSAGPDWRGENEVEVAGPMSKAAI